MSIVFLSLTKNTIVGLENKRIEFNTSIDEIDKKGTGDKEQ